MTEKHILLKNRLEELYTSYHSSYLYSDPLKYLHLYEKPEDREIVGLIASSLAYGRVERIFVSIEYVLDVIGPNPADYVKDFDPFKDAADFKGFIHRFNRGEDIASLLWFVRQVIESCGAIGGLFSRIYREEAGDIKRALSAFTAYILRLDSSPFYGGGSLPQDAGVRYFFPSPDKGSACKRLNLYLRWMARPDDGVDLGLWSFIDPANLIMPIDTHIARLSKNLGLTSLKSPNWKMAEEITANLKLLDPADPLRYDFALCRLGILDICPLKKDNKRCLQCGIKEICLL